MDNWITLLYIWIKWSNILQYKIKVKLKKKKQKQQKNACSAEGTAQYSWGNVQSWWPGLVSHPWRRGSLGSQGWTVLGLRKLARKWRQVNTPLKTSSGAGFSPSPDPGRPTYSQTKLSVVPKGSQIPWTGRVRNSPPVSRWGCHLQTPSLESPYPWKTEPSEKRCCKGWDLSRRRKIWGRE